MRSVGVALAVVALWAAEPVARACSMAHIRSAEELCSDAEVIVVAVARRYEAPTVYSEDGSVVPGRIEFAVREVVKG